VTTTEVLLATLQNADSFFPSSGVSFSWGLETLIADGCVRQSQELAACVEGQLRYRWAVCDRPALVESFRAGGDILRTQRIDSEVEALTLARELRDGSRRAGAALLTVHERLGTPGAAQYRRAVRTGSVYGHLSVVQGLLWRGAGLSETAAEAASAYTLCVSLLGAALRLGVIGHLQTQETLLRLRSITAALLAVSAPPLDQIYTCAPALEIAAMRHETQSSRLFAN
jgi:urease accessory protein